MTMCFNVKKLVMVAAMGFSALSVTACSTTSTVRVAEGAPITYRVDQAALRKPSMPRVTSLPEARPSYAIPSPYITQDRPMNAPRQMVEAPAPTMGPLGVPFDPSRVDYDLYKHQKVGDRYTIMGQSYTPRHDPRYDKVGEASWYGDKFHGKPTATGEIYNKNDMTAAHKTLPLNSMLHVTNIETGKSIMVRLNDRGPFVDDRIIDLSEAAARALGTIEQGIGRVRVRYVGPADPMASQQMVEAPRPQPMPFIPPAVRDITPQQPSYEPLRRQAPLPELAERPQPQAVPQYRAPQPTVPQSTAPQQSIPQEYAPYVPPAAPQPRTAQKPKPQPITPPKSAEPQPDEVITLTIKGPIHMARSSTETKGHWIPAVNYTNHPK